MQSILELKDRHSGPCYIVGKGESLDFIRAEDFPIASAPIICLNQIVPIIEQLNLPNPQYSLQQDGWISLERTIDPGKMTLLTSIHNKHIFKNGYMYDQENDLKIKDKICSAVSASAIAKLMGCNHLIFIAFDSITDGNVRHPKFFTENYADYDNTKAYARIKDQILLHLGILQMPATFKNREIQVADYTIITPTGDRPSFDLCRKFVTGQTILPRQWLVVDDGKIPIHHTTGMDYFRRETSSRDPKHTLKTNLLHIIDKIKCDTIMIFEDDDYYRADYAETMLKNLGNYALIHLDNVLIYNVKYNMYQRFKSSSFCAFANFCFKKKILPQLRSSCQGTQANNDVALLQMVKNKKKIDLGDIFVGIKGLDGRPGTTRPHKLDTLLEYKYVKDDRTVLKEALGEDYKYYANMKSIDFKIKNSPGAIPGTRNIGGKIIMIRRNKKIEKYLDSIYVKHTNGVWLDVALDKSP